MSGDTLGVLFVVAVISGVGLGFTACFFSMLAWQHRLPHVTSYIDPLWRLRDGSIFTDQGKTFRATAIRLNAGALAAFVATFAVGSQLPVCSPGQRGSPCRQSSNPWAAVAGTYHGQTIDAFFDVTLTDDGVLRGSANDSIGSFRVAGDTVYLTWRFRRQDSVPEIAPEWRRALMAAAGFSADTMVDTLRFRKDTLYSRAGELFGYRLKR